MRQFPELDPMTVDQDPRVVGKIDDRPHPFAPEIIPTYYFLIDDNYLIIARTGFYLPTKEWHIYQIEFPKWGLIWFLDSLLNRFTRTEAEGGLRKKQFDDEGVVGGERLLLSRCFGLRTGARNEGQTSGYKFATLDRKNEDGQRSRSHSFTDEYLFQDGMLDLMKEIAQKIQNGEL